MAGISSLTATLKQSQQWSAQNNLTGSSYAPTTNANQITKTNVLGTAIANNMLGGADELVSYQVTITASSSATISTASITDILQTAGVSLARVKAFCFRLLDASDDPVFGTAAVSIAVGNAGSDPLQLGLSASATQTIFTGGCMQYQDDTAGGFVTSGSAFNLKFANNSSTLSACVQITLVGGSS